MFVIPSRHPRAVPAGRQEGGDLVVNYPIRSVVTSSTTYGSGVGVAGASPSASAGELATMINAIVAIATRSPLVRVFALLRIGLSPSPLSGGVEKNEKRFPSGRLVAGNFFCVELLTTLRFYPPLSRQRRDKCTLSIGVQRSIYVQAHILSSALRCWSDYFLSSSRIKR